MLQASATGKLVGMNRQQIETAIVRRCAEDLIAAGHTISVDDGEALVLTNSTDVEAITGVMFATEMEFFRTNHPAKGASFVQFVYGNDGPDVIADHGVKLTDDLESVTAYALSLES